MNHRKKKIVDKENAEPEEFLSVEWVESMKKWPKEYLIELLRKSLLADLKRSKK